MTGPVSTARPSRAPFITLTERVVASCCCQLRPPVLFRVAMTGPVSTARPSRAPFITLTERVVTVFVSFVSPSGLWLCEVCLLEVSLLYTELLYNNDVS